MHSQNHLVPKPKNIQREDPLGSKPIFFLFDNISKIKARTFLRIENFYEQKLDDAKKPHVALPG